jgi:sarcosine oxidase
VGLDARGPLHREGSSHGESRIIRTAYYEHPDYVPLAKESFRLWTRLEQETHGVGYLLENRACLTVGKPDSEVVAGVVRAAAEHGLAVEQLDAGELEKQFDWLKSGQGWKGALEQEAGILHADRCMQALARRAGELGADFRFETAVREWGSNRLGIWVKTDGGVIEGDRLVLCPGPWALSLIGPIAKPLRVMRQVSGWTEIAGGVPAGLPVFFFDTPEGYFYGMRAADGSGVKMARHYGAPECGDVGEIENEPVLQDRVCLEGFARKHTPGLCELGNQETIGRLEVCRYTLSPDRQFVVGELPGHCGLVHVAGGMSGHGFKFAPAIGEMVTAGLLEGKRPLEMFSPGRFG